MALSTFTEYRDALSRLQPELDKLTKEQIASLLETTKSFVAALEEQESK